MLPYSFGFESGEDASLWQQFRSDSQDWEMEQSGSTPSFNTGPSGAQSGGQYAYVEATSHSLDSALLTADFDFTDALDPEISFHYHMDGSGRSEMGNLYFEVSTDGGLIWDRLFSRSGDQGDDWEEVTVNLSAYAGQVVRMHFRADVGTGYRSDIAIDTILVADTLADPPANFSTWLSDNYPNISDTTPEGDPDGDGVRSFLEYALGRSPETADSGGLPASEIDTDAQKLIFSFKRSRDEVRYVVVGVENLSDWSNPDVIWDSWSNPPPADLVGEGLIQAVEIDMNDDSCFVRLKVSE